MYLYADFPPGILLAPPDTSLVCIRFSIYSVEGGRWQDDGMGFKLNQNGLDFSEVLSCHSQNFFFNNTYKYLNVYGATCS